MKKVLENTKGIGWTALKQGDKIGILAFSSACEEEEFCAGLKFIESLGFLTKVALSPYGNYKKYNHLFSSDTSLNRAKAFLDLIKDPAVKAIIAARGGYGAMELLPFLDFKLLGRIQKPLVGFSDTTALLIPFFKIGGGPAIHGPVVGAGFARASAKEQARESVLTLISLLKREYPSAWKKVKLAHLLGAENLEGPIIGGNLTLISHLLGTSFEPNFDGQVVFFEDLNEKPYRIHRMLLQLKLAGKFENVRGVILGSFRKCEDETDTLSPSVKDVCIDIFKSLKFPVFGGAPIGHQDLNLPLSFGDRVKIAGQQIEFLDYS